LQLVQLNQGELVRPALDSLSGGMGWVSILNQPTSSAAIRAITEAVQAEVNGEGVHAGLLLELRTLLAPLLAEASTWIDHSLYFAIRGLTKPGFADLTVRLEDLPPGTAVLPMASPGFLSSALRSERLVEAAVAYGYWSYLRGKRLSGWPVSIKHCKVCPKLFAD